MPEHTGVMAANRLTQRDDLTEGVRLVVDSVTRSDAAGREVTQAARQLRSVLDATAATARVTVVGGGPTGIETAAELAEQGRRVTLACGGVLGPYLHARARRRATKRLADGRKLPSAVTVWATGFGVPDLAARSGLRTDPVGRCISLGRRAVVFRLARKDDTAMRLYVAGRPGAKLKELACEFSVRHLAAEARRPGSQTWPEDNGHRRPQAAEHATAPATAGRPA